MKLLSSQRFLAIYSGVLTLVFAGTVLMGARSGTPQATFDQITVHRINVVEPNGTLRMVISNAADAPGSYQHGREYARPDRTVAGIIFLNDEGTENGGLIFGGSKDKDGKVSGFGHLSFDNYDQDQSMVIQSYQPDSDKKSAYVQINDTPEWSEEDLFKLQEKNRDLPENQKKAAIHAFFRTHPRAKTRVYLGTNDDHSSELMLTDSQGRPRIVAEVDANDKPTLKFLDSNGKVVQQFPQATRQ